MESQNIVSDEQGMTIRPWLVKHTNENDYGLAWFDDKKTFIKIPWPTSVHHPDSVKDLKICVAWSKHRGKYSEPPAYSKIKARFRCALDKSKHFDYRQDLSETDRQFGSFRVYELKSGSKSKDVKPKKQKRPHPHIDDHPSLNNSIEAPQCKDNLGPFGNCLIPMTSNPADPLALTQGFMQNIEQPVDDLYHSSLYLPTPLEANYLPVEALAKSQQNFEINEMDAEPSTSNGTIGFTPVTPQHEKILNQKFDFVAKNPEKLAQYKMCVYYRQVGEYNVPIIEQIKENLLLDLSHSGARLLYGDFNTTSGFQAADEAPEQSYPLPKANTINPEIAVESTLVGKVLKNFDGGISFCMDEKHNLKVTRHCQSQVFYFENPSINSNSIKMNQGEPIILFSLENYINELIRFSRELGAPKPEKIIPIVIGSKPKTLTSNALVRVTFEHVLASDLEKRFGISDSLPQLAVSNPPSNASNRAAGFLKMLEVNDSLPEFTFTRQSPNASHQLDELNSFLESLYEYANIDTAT
ncbi:interferon regulatory factor 4-like isoform X2 [Clavelina lepadiformis]|uniref:interferon regulatory factor 4-like isoform X2 n=1 Tax=Clavelina lepadiformis TaxID=159417 RepID=UPI004042BC47